MTGISKRHFRSAVCYIAGLATVLFFCVKSSRVRAQAKSVDVTAYLRQHQAELKLADLRLAGPAANWLRDEASKAQFVFIGEEHDTREIPMIAAAFWRELVPLGYRHVAIEAGPWLGDRLDRFARFANEQALAQFKSGALPRRPNVSIPPSSEEDIAFYKALGQGGRYPLPLIWGIDHEYTVTPLLKRLLELVRDKTRHQQIEMLMTRVAEAEKAGRYDMQPFKSEIEAVTLGISARSGSEAEHIRGALHERLFGVDVKKQLFLSNYRAAQAAGEEHPRVMLRFGSYHAKRGLMSEFGTSTLANFVGELGAAEKGQMINVIFIDCALDSKDDWRAPKDHPRPCSPRERTWLRPFAGAAMHKWTLFDMRDLRKEVRAGRVDVNRELWEVIYGFDAVVLLKESTASHFQN